MTLQSSAAQQSQPSYTALTMEHGYPNRQVIRRFMGLGGIIGGGLVGLLGFVIFFEIQALLFIPLAMFVGFFVGFIPATVTGVIIAQLGLYRNTVGLIQASSIGAIVTSGLVLFGVLWVKENFDTPLLLSAALLGGLSALITGLIVLPKRESQNDQ